jgi:hypothetical protein
MNKLIPLVVVLIVVASVIGGVFALSKRATPTNPTSENIVADDTPGTPLQSLQELLSSGQTQECSFNDGTGNEGVVYVGNNKLRGDFTSLADNQKVNSHMIVDGKMAYVWTEGQGTGVKVTFDPEQIQVPEGQEGTLDIGQENSYNCKAWTVNPSLYTLPASVTFTDMGQFTAPQVEGDTKVDCSVCDQAPEANRAQCLAALKCS